MGIEFFFLPCLRSNFPCDRTIFGDFIGNGKYSWAIKSLVMRTFYSCTLKNRREILLEGRENLKKLNTIEFLEKRLLVMVKNYSKTSKKLLITQNFWVMFLVVHLKISSNFLGSKSFWDKENISGPMSVRRGEKIFFSCNQLRLRRFIYTQLPTPHNNPFNNLINRYHRHHNQRCNYYYCYYSYRCATIL